MSGHSKWATIKRKKQATDAKRSNVFSKIGKELTIAVRDGGPDPNINRKLRDVIAKAKSNNMPNDNIKRCIDKASGNSNSVNYEELSYEGFGPCNTTVIVDVVTDNKNRSASDVRNIFTKSGGTLGQSGSVNYMFDKKGVIIVEKTNNIDEDEFMLEAIENNAEDVIIEEEYIELICDPSNYYSLREFVESKNHTIAESEIKMLPNMKKDLTEEELVKFEKFIDKLEENDDVKNIWHNVNE